MKFFSDDKIFVFLNHIMIPKIHLYPYFTIKMCIISMDKIGITIHRYVISCIDRINRCDTRFLLCIEYFFPLSPHVRSIISSEFWLDEFSSLLFFIHYFIIDTNTWLFMSFFLSNNPIKWTVILNFDTMKVWIYHNINTFWCIQMI